MSLKNKVKKMQVAPLGFTGAHALSYFPEEIAVITGNNVGLYFDKVKDEYWTKCKIVLTSKRVFLQREIGEEDILPNIFFYLDQIVKIDYHKGFLASSPKIGVILSVPRDRPGSIPKSISIWTCNLCRHNNPLMEGTIKCSECGSRIPPNVLASAEAEAAGTEPDVFVRIRLGFRSGGSSAFYEKFIYTLDRIMSQKSEKLQVPSGPLEARANTPTSFSSEVSSRSVGGLSNIMNRIEITQKETSTQLNSAFEDLDSLIAKASDMVAIADRLSKQLNKVENDEETKVLQDIYVSLGFSNPITKEMTTTDRYYIELASELSSLLNKLFADLSLKTSIPTHFIPLADVYCFWNRARGTALVSPNDVHQAATLLSQVKSSFCLETFASGLASICKREFGVEALLAQIYALYISNMRVDFYKDMTQLVDFLQVPFSILKEVMTLAESKGLVCRDDTISALKFYPNFILNARID